MDKKNLQALIIALPLLFVGGGWASFNYLFSPLNKKVKAVRKELIEIRKEAEAAAVKAARLPQLEQEISVLRTEITELEKKLPPGKDVPGLIRLLSKKMDKYHVTWSRLAPGTQNIRDYYVEHSYSIPFSCTYHDLALFLTDIGQMERIFATRFTRLNNTVDPKTGAPQVPGRIDISDLYVKGIDWTPNP